MRQLICILCGFFLSYAANAAASMSTTYDDFQKIKSQFLSAKMTRNDFSKKFKKVDAELNAKYSKLKSFEKTELTVEGNQLALDLELLQPLRDLAKSKINKENCQEALSSNQRNLTAEEKNQTDAIEKLIKSVCF